MLAWSSPGPEWHRRPRAGAVVHDVAPPRSRREIPGRQHVDTVLGAPWSRLQAHQHADEPHRTFCFIRRPRAVSRYFWFFADGAPGRVISTSPADIAGCR